MPTAIQRPILPAEINDINEVRFTEKQIALVKALQERVAPAIIASGLFSGAGDVWVDALGILAESDPTERSAAKALDAFFHAPGNHDALIAHPTPDDPDREDWASDVSTNRAYCWGDAGVMLGIAIGMLLGPHAFGGVR